jgi:hypothetical protein
MKKSSTSLAITEMQIKTTLRFHFTPFRIAIVKGKKPKCAQGFGKIEPLYTFGGNSN